VPTILEAAQVKHPTEFAGHAVLPLEGTSLLRTITDGTLAGPRQLGFEHETNRGWIDGNFKLVVRHENADALELYDLSTDPSELQDLASAQPARLANMVSAWNAWATRVGVPAARQLQPPDGG
jgi:arylsulfatase A-like enzyme